MKTRTVVGILLAAASPFFTFAAPETENAAVLGPVKSVYDHYLKIQTALAKDSLKGVDEHANAIVKTVKSEGVKMLPARVATEADTLAKAKDLKAAREAFKPLSSSLIKYLKENQAGKDTYREAYCPMAKASWLQTEKSIKNPYFGKEMLTCGEFKN